MKGREPDGTGRAHVHLVCGSTGAGKTTYSLALAAELAAVRFSIDQWMSTLFWMDRADPIDPAWAMSRVRRCYEQIWSVSAELLDVGVPVVLDLGFSTAEDRRIVATRAAGIGVPVTLHVLNVAADERWRRVVERNGERGSLRQLDFPVTRAMFDYVESLWEAPSEEEMLALNAVRFPSEDPPHD